MKRRRSDSKDSADGSISEATTAWNIQERGSSGVCGRRVHSKVCVAGSISVWTNSFWKAGWSASLAADPSTTSA